MTDEVGFSDAKTVLCAYYKAGHCDKGNKCKFSHDLNVGRKVEKKDLYSDTREEKLKGQSRLDDSEGSEIDSRSGGIDTMDEWDEDELRSVGSAKAMRVRAISCATSSRRSRLRMMAGSGKIQMVRSAWVIYRHQMRARSVCTDTHYSPSFTRSSTTLGLRK